MHGKCEGMHAWQLKCTNTAAVCTCPVECCSTIAQNSRISPELSSSAREATGTLQALAALSALALPFAGTSTNLDFASSK